MQLATDICLIRDWQASDKPSLVSLANSRKIWRNLTHLFPHPYTEADADNWLSYLAGISPATHWAIEYENKLAGGIGLFLGDGVHARTAQLGYWVGEPFWGQGIATSAVRAITPYALTEYSLCRIEAAVFSWNPASARALEKVGYRREGVLRNSIYKDGQVIDSVMYAFTV